MTVADLEGTKKGTSNVTNNVYVNWPAGNKKKKRPGEEDQGKDGGQGKMGWAGLMPWFVSRLRGALRWREWFAGKQDEKQ